MTTEAKRRPRGPGVAYAALTTVMALVVGIVAMTATQPPPPTIAEFAPQAVEQIDEAPSEQTSEFGSGEGGLGTGGAFEPTPPPVADEVERVIDVPRIRRCVGDPPRQTEDPQSPPCIPYWDGDNGGATTRGVTADEIRVAWPEVEGADARMMDAVLAHFNRRYEFYGRRITLHPLSPTGGNDGDPEPAQMQADAQTADSMEVFASLQYLNRLGAEHHYYDELARRRIVSVTSRPTQRSDRHFLRHDPYQWNYLPSSTEILRELSSWVCSALVGQAPEHAGGATANEPERVFGVFYERTKDGNTIDLQTLRDGLARCGVSTEGREFEVDSSSGPNAQQFATIALAMRQAGVTSVLTLSGAAFLVMRAASSNAYFPEWLVSTLHNLDYHAAGGFFPRDQAERTFGITSWNKMLPRTDMPWYWALKAGDPGAGGGSYVLAYEFYTQLLLLASGIQMAGPELTPESFRDGLVKTTFPNPRCGRAPYFQACVGFSPGDRTMIGDSALIWWNPNERPASGEEQVGAYCYAQQGLRYAGARWAEAADARFFQPPCA